MKNKQSQITFMMILGIIVLLIAGLIAFASGYLKIFDKPLVFDKANIESYMNNCLKKTAENGLVLLGKQGGYLNLEDFMQTPNYGISYLYNKEDKVPGIEKMQSQLSAYINNNLNICLKDFDDFKKQGWKVEKGSQNSGVQINERDVSFNVDFPIKVTNNEDVINFERFSTTLNVRLKYIHNLAARIVDLNSRIPGSVDRTELSRYDLNITVFSYENSMIYTIQDSKSSLVNKPYQFNFAMKFGDKI